MAENEIKFVIRGYADLEQLLTPLGYYDIEQGYLNRNNRVRRVILQNGTRQHFFAYKQRLANGHNLEIEPPISAAEYDEAWDYTEQRLYKRRVPIDHNGLKWDIDFYRWRHPYFVLAEVEMPLDMTSPEIILPYLQDRVVYEVPRYDGRFTARRLADEDHVQSLAKELKLMD